MDTPEVALIRAKFEKKYIDEDLSCMLWLNAGGWYGDRDVESEWTGYLLSHTQHQTAVTTLLEKAKEAHVQWHKNGGMILKEDVIQWIREAFDIPVDSDANH